MNGWIRKMEIFETIMIDAGRKIFRDSVSRAGTQIFKNGKNCSHFQYLRYGNERRGTLKKKKNETKCYRNREHGRRQTFLILGETKTTRSYARLFRLANSEDQNHGTWLESKRKEWIRVATLWSPTFSFSLSSSSYVESSNRGGHLRQVLRSCGERHFVYTSESTLRTVHYHCTMIFNKFTRKLLIVFTLSQDITTISLFLFHPELIYDHEILHKIKYVTKTFFL